MYAIVHGVEGLSAGKSVADQEHRYTCSQSLPKCDLRPDEKSGTQAETEQRTEIKRNREYYKRNGGR